MRGVMFKSFTLLFLSILLMSCASKIIVNSSILDLAFPAGEYEVLNPDIVFQVGYLGNEQGYYGYLIDDNKLYVARASRTNKSIRKHILSVDSCDGLHEQIENLKASLLQSSEVALGSQPKLETERAMLDGFHYNLQYRGKVGVLSLSGYGIYKYEMPWVKFAEKINSTALACVENGKR